MWCWTYNLQIKCWSFVRNELLSYFLVAELWVSWNQDPNWTNSPHSSLGLATLPEQQIHSIPSAASGQAVEILYLMRRGPMMIHQCGRGTGADSSPRMPSWRGKSGQSWTCRVVSGRQLCCYLCCLWSCCRVRFFGFLFVWVFFYPCRNKHVKTTGFSFARNCTQRDNTNHVWFSQD